MLVLRCTQRVLKRLKVKPDPEPPESSTALGDWYVDVRSLQPRHLLLFVSEKTRFPVVTPAAPMSALQPRFLAALFKQLCAIGIEAPAVDEEIARMKQTVIAKTASRSVLGTMVDYQHMITAHSPVQNPLNLSLRMAKAPCGPLGMKSSIAATRAALESLKLSD